MLTDTNMETVGTLPELAWPTMLPEGTDPRTVEEIKVLCIGYDCWDPIYHSPSGAYRIEADLTEGFECPSCGHFYLLDRDGVVWGEDADND